MLGRSPTLSSIHRLLVYILVVATPWSIYPLIETDSRGVKPFVVVAAVVAFVGGVRILQRDTALRLNVVTKSVLVFYAIAVSSLIGFTMSGGGWADLIGYGTLFMQLCVFVALILSVSLLDFDKPHIHHVVYICLGVSVLVGVYAIYQSLARINQWPFAYLEIYNPSFGMREGQGGGEFGGFIRPSATFTEPSRLGQFLLTPTLVSGFLFMSSPRERKRGYFLVLFILLGSGFTLAFSMGAYIAMAAALGSALFIKGVRRYSGRLVLGWIGAIGLLSVVAYPILGFPLPEMIAERTAAHLHAFGIADTIGQGPFASNSVTTRLLRAKAGLQVWLENPILGVGLNNFGRLFPAGVAPRIHSALVQSLAEMGMLGGIGFFVLAFVPPVKLLHVSRQIGGWEKGAFLGVGLGLLGRAVWMIVAGNYILEFFWLDMTLATILLSYNSSVERRRAQMTRGA